MQAQLVASVQHSLSMYLYDNAKFLCERLAAEFPSEANTHLLATCYYRAGQPFRAYRVLQKTTFPASRYLLALACMQLPDKLPEAERVLDPGRNGKDVAGGAAGYLLLGRIARMTNRRDQAAAHFSAALEHDPLLWQAFEELCHLGAEQEARAWLGGTDDDDAHGAAGSGSAMSGWGQPGGSQGPQRVPQRYEQQQQPAHWEGWEGFRPSGAAQPQHAFQFPAPQQPTPQQPFAGGTPFTATPNGFGGAGHAPSPVNAFTFGTHMSPSPMQWGQGPGRGLPTPADDAGAAQQTPPGGGEFVTPSPPGNAPMPPPPQRNNGVRGIGVGVGGAGRGRGRGGRAPAHQQQQQQQQPPDSAELSGGTQRKNPGRLFQDTAPGLRRSSRVAPAPADAQQPDSSSLQMATPGSAWPPLQPNEEVIDVPAGGSDSGAAPSAAGSEEGQQAVLALLHALGRGYLHLSWFRCEEAIAAFERLPRQHRDTGWVQCQLGRCWYEKVDYPQARLAFESARRREAHRLEGMEVFSTVLWHLKEELALSHLAQQVIAQDRHSPHAWAVLGNCFSLQKEHETALRFFNRATQVEPNFTYAYTLAGHEYLANEDFQRGLEAYRTALRLDPRHYNAWYGLGQIYFRQEHWAEAESHFRLALDINSRSSVLHCYHGMALHKLERHPEALDRLQVAISADPKNPLAKFERANVLLSMDRLDEALAELQVLKVYSKKAELVQDLAPREASVHFQLGKVHKRLEQPDAALMAFHTALDLRPSAADANLIKSAIERVRAPDDESEEEI